MFLLIYVAIKLSILSKPTVSCERKSLFSWQYWQTAAQFNTTPY